MGLSRALGRWVVGITATLVAAGAPGCSHKTDYGGVDISITPLSRTLRGDKLVQQSYAAVVTVETDVGRGMGFVVDPAGYIVTNRHVVEDADHLEGVVFPALDPNHVYESVRIVYIDPLRDLALLHVKAKQDLPYVPFATRRHEPTSRYLSQADPVVLLQRQDSPRVNPGLIVRRGQVNELSAFNPAAGPGTFVGVTADVVQGQSGGPVLDAHGRAVGIVTWTWRDRAGGYAIPIAEATRMLEERPEMSTAGDHRHRVESRVRTFLDAVAQGDSSSARRLTSPSHARTVRKDALERLLGDASAVDPDALKWFIVAIEELANVDPTDDDAVTESFESLEDIVAATGSDQMRKALGIEDAAGAKEIIAFFHEFGQAYLAARMFGDQEPDGAMASATRRLATVDAARTFALARSAEALRQRDVIVETVEIVPGEYKPTAVVTLATTAGTNGTNGTDGTSGTNGTNGTNGTDGVQRLSVHLRLEWGDWYVAAVRRAALSEAG